MMFCVFNHVGEDRCSWGPFIFPLKVSSEFVSMGNKEEEIRLELLERSVD
jgi:hypothetical protein